MAPSIVSISSGLVQGIRSERNDGVIAYKGIPYAATTAGDNRWRAPQPREAWEGVFVADAYGANCPQIPFGPMNILPQQSEDCLNLNVWTPAEASAGDKLSVFVWIYGGRFIAGSGSEHTYDGTSLASKGIIVVTLNYRCGILGFLATPELSKESGHGASGNYGILDQWAALTWVHENIAAFGGDPDKVTIGGQSAGAASTGIHLLSPLSKGLFRAAISQSGQRYSRDPLLSGLAPAYRTKDKAEAQGLAILREKGANTMAEMRAMPLHDLLVGNNKNDDVWGNPPFYRPCIDGWVFPLTYEKALGRGLAADVPVMTGHNADEGGTYADPDFDIKDYRACAQQKYGPLAERFFELYPTSAAVSAREAWNQAARDQSRVTTSLWAEQFHQHAKSPVYGYFYGHAPPPRKGGPDAPPARQAAGAAGPDIRAPKLRIYENAVPRSEYTYSKIGPGARHGAFHGAELAFVFDNLHNQEGYEYRDVDHKVASTASAYWVNFIKHSDPNGGNAPIFEPMADNKIMYLGEDCHSMSLTESAARLEFWKEHLHQQKPW